MVDILTDKHGRRIGSIRNEGNRLVARDRDGLRVGYYEPATDSTRSMDGRKIADGNALRQLLER